MKITIILALALAAVYVAQAEQHHERDSQEHVLEKEQDTGIVFQKLDRLRRASCSIDRCSANCRTRGKDAVCRKGRCKCY